MARSSTEYSLKNLRDRGFIAEVVERFNTFSRRRIDLFSVIDIVAIKPDEILGVQATSYGAATEHRKKIREEPKVRSWLEAGGKLELHLWRKIKNRWQVKIETIV